MLAQALVEYGALAALVSAIQRVEIVAEDLLRQVDSRLAIAAVVVVAISLLRRRR